MKLLNRKLIKTTLTAILTLTGVGIAAFLFMQYRVFSTAKPHITPINSAPKSQAILVLGALVYSDGTPSPALKARLDCGAELYRNGVAPKILVSGDNGKVAYNEVSAMRNYLIACQIPAEDIILDYAGFNTYDSCYRARDVFSLNSITIVSQNYHIPRAVYIARTLGLDATGVGTSNYVLNNLPYNYTREALARVKAVIETEILHRLPKFL